MDMNFPHNALTKEPHTDSIDLNSIRSSIIASASVRQASSKTAKLLQIVHTKKKHLKKSENISELKARILFFARPKKFMSDSQAIDHVMGAFSSVRKFKKTNYESAVNLNTSNYVKSSLSKSVNHNNDDNTQTITIKSRVI